MFREMRRKKKEIGTESAKELLKNSRRGVIAVNGDDGYPYAVPINYLYDSDENKIYFHGSRVGHKTDSIKACDKICFTVFGNETVKDEKWAPYLQSTVVFGRCHLMESNDESMQILKKLAMKYYPSVQVADEEIERSGKAVQMFEIEIEHITGKEIQER